MEEDPGVKAPVTRLRRRLSVEQTEESKSPAVNTPTKKRGGRKAAKPELELIDENTPDITTRRRATKKTTKDVEPEEKTVTPSRRTTRIKSNTSIISETALPEEKTPSKRATRIKSNSTIIAETALAIDSPRAKRAQRRASTTGSDGEPTNTPIRQTRRTRKDSASSVEKEPQLPDKQGMEITVIIEEPEGSTTKLTPPETMSDQSNSPNSIRKSPRLLEKINKTTPPKKRDLIEESGDDIPVLEPTTTTTTNSSKDSSDSISLTSHTPKTKVDVIVQKNEVQPTQNRFLLASANLIKDLSVEVKSKSNLNKSASDAESRHIVTNRKRTKSWTTLSASNDSQFCSDNESTKNKIIPVLINRNGSGDGLLNTSLKHDISNKSVSKTTKMMNDSMNYTVENISEPLDKFNSIENNNERKDETVSCDQNNSKNDDAITSEILKNEPSGLVKTLVFIEDSDSNSEKVNIQKRHEHEDQCVPVVEQHVEAFPLKVNSFTSMLAEQNDLNESKELSNRKDSDRMDCEPMDIDETIPENEIIPELQSSELNTTERKSISTSVPISNLSSEDIVNKSRRKSSITQSLDKSGIETRSTLILSQIKDSSTGDINNVSKSPQVTNNKLLSKSVDDLNITQENDIKKNLSLHYSTSTPLQNKNIQMFKGIHVNTSIIASQNNDSRNNIKLNDKEQYNVSKTKYKELAEDDDLKESSHTINEENKGNSKRPSNKETSIIQSEFVHSKESKKEIETEKDKLNVNHSNGNDENSYNQQNESKSDDVSLDKKSKRLASGKKIKKNVISSSEESEEEIESNDEPSEKSNLFDNEALDAGDDYESGDSQDESERRYEKENEVIDKGETLTTDEEFSEDSDYEKDSFVVSSNEEDEELLEGSEEDLSMSDNELKMTAKSKKKFNERKIKEQKKASREMFESRHRLNSSSKSSNSEIGATKKKRRQQISSSESEEDIPVKPMKKNRLRLDSTKEASLLTDESEHKISKKKNKHLLDSDSNSDESGPNEKEMTIRNETIKESDPLSIKTEPKTPQNSTNSTITLFESEDVNDDAINNLLKKTENQLLDSLHATMVADDDNDSLSSDTGNKIQNYYDAVLKDLNKSSNLKTKVSVSDISLNLDKKRKNKVKTSIVDELNLTQVKSYKKPKNKQEKVYNNNVKEILPKAKDHDTSSDSIDLHLLFSEESNHSDTSSLQNKMKNNRASINSEVIIPLKRTEAKTDVRESKAIDNSKEVSFNQSKRKSQLKENTSSDEESVRFFIDTVGSHDDSSDKSHISSVRNKNQSTENIDFALDKSVNKSAIKTQAKENSDDDAPVEISFKKEKNSQRKSKSQDNIDIVIDEQDVADKSINNRIAETPSSENKKKRKTMSDEILELSENVADKSINKSIAKTPRSDKKNKRKIPDDEILEQADNVADKYINNSIAKTPRSDKKNKRKTLDSEILEQTEVVADKYINNSIAKTPRSEKKNKTQLMDSEILEQADDVADKYINNSIAKTPRSEKKNKRKTLDSEILEQTDDVADKSLNNSMNKTPSSEKKNKRKKMDNEIIYSEILKQADNVADKSIDNSFAKTSGSEKKNKKKTKGNEILDQADIQEVPIESATSEKKKKKKIASNSLAVETPSIPDIQEVPIESATSEKKKKKKIASNSLAVETPSIPEITENIETSSKKRKRKSSLNTTKEENLPTDVDTAKALNESLGSKKKKRKITSQDEIATDGLSKKRNRKRKEREDDETPYQTSKIQEIAFNKVPRLPPALLEKLDAVPHKEVPAKKPKVTSTTEFLVQETKKRKTKPSNYLEESVYLNETSEKKRSNKKRLDKPKVLPFVPTVSTSSSGFTTNFKINVIPSEIKFVAQSNTISNFRENVMYNNKIRRLGTYDLYKRQVNVKMSKF